MLFLTLISLGLAAGLVAAAADTGDSGSDADITRNTDGSEDVRLTGGTDVFLGADSGEDIGASGGDDLIFAEGGNDTVSGGSGGDLLFGQEGDDNLSGNEGDDYIADGRGSDTISGGSGNDTLVSGNFMSEDALAAEADAGNYNLSRADIDRILNITMDSDSDTEGDSVSGGTGEDYIYFGENDTVSGGAGQDSLIAGDWMTGGDAAVVTDYNGSEDRLIYWHDASEPDPVLSQADDGGDRIVYADGLPVLRLEGAAGREADVLLVART
jgi:Ca2+-binding RTX toxin-like protein